MSDNYTQLNYHFVWATKGRHDLITEAVEGPLFDYIHALCRQLGVQVLAMNGIPNHIHIACSLPTRLSVGAFAKDIKGKSSHFINRLEGDKYFLAWQPGYGALTFSKKELDVVTNYVRRQKEHHKVNQLIASLEKCGTEESERPADESETGPPVAPTE